MIARIRKHLSYANMAMTVAVVFAMGGGAYAAGKYKITSIKQIKPTVVATLKGKPGPAGQNGKDGAPGPEGKQGPEGGKGATGAPGATGPAGAPGAPGEEGPQGEPWVPNNTLPSGATETGEWSVFSSAAKTAELRFTVISFPIQLSAVPTLHYVNVGEPVPSECEGGSAAEPKAKPGNLCIFEGEGLLHEGGLILAGNFNSGNTEFGPGKVGVTLAFQSSKTGEVSVEGSWAVTGA